MKKRSLLHDASRLLQQASFFIFNKCTEYIFDPIDRQKVWRSETWGLSLIHISEPTRH